jgi:adenylate cyclase
MTDESHAQAEDHVRQQNLSPHEAEAHFDATAQEVLRTVNLYLGTIADTVKQHEGTLDKYIGDCVMAFWGAPTPNAEHAVACVRAAIDAQKAIEALNQNRAAENAKRQAENLIRKEQGQELLLPLKLLTMGSGINTGVVTVGLMGSEQHTFNYTVFGREVNLAARLEGLSGHGRIVIGQGTYRALQTHCPVLAATCQELAPATVKGFRTPVRIYEVPWRDGATVPLTPEEPTIKHAETRPLAA